MTGSPLYRTPAAALTPQLSAVRRRYDALAADVATVAAAPVAAPEVSTRMAALLRAEARWLDSRRWSDWLQWCGDDTVVWVPLSVEQPHPAADQSLFLDDRGRLDERVWRFTDPNAWALLPAGQVVRGVSAVEAWEGPDQEVLVASVLTLQHVRAGKVWSTVGRQVHRIRLEPRGAGVLVHKILLLPGLDAGTAHLGWLL